MRRASAVLLTLAALYLVWCILAALRTDSLLAAGSRLAAEPWGWVTIVDLYVGFLVTAGVIVFREKRVVVWLPWLVALAVLGNVVTAGYALRWMRTLAPPVRPAKPSV